MLLLFYVKGCQLSTSHLHFEQDIKKKNYLQKWQLELLIYPTNYVNLINENHVFPVIGRKGIESELYKGAWKLAKILINNKMWDFYKFLRQFLVNWKIHAFHMSDGRTWMKTQFRMVGLNCIHYICHQFTLFLFYYIFVSLCHTVPLIGISGLLSSWASLR